MNAKPVRLREQAERDIAAAIAHYLDEQATEAAVGFVDALEIAYHHLGAHAATGSLRHGQELGLPGLRSWPLSRYPYLVFYVEAPDHIDVWRVLHTRRDIPQRMRDEWHNPEDR